MFNSTNFNTTFYEDNNNNNNNNIPLLYSQQPSEEITPFYYYDHIQSPLFYYDVENFVESLNNHDELTIMIQEPLQGTNSSVVTDDSSILEVTTTKKMMDSSIKGDEVSGMVNNNKPKRRRTSTKDRHSKIKTAQGLRDRRMRLSLDVAKPFFRLQDMLGFDKASKTVEWLLNQSKLVIDELKLSKIGTSIGVTKCTTISSTSDCEGESIVVDQNNGNNIINKGKKSIVNVAKDGKDKEKRLRTTKEAMKKARDKARKRTLEKIQSRGGIINNKEDNNNNNNNDAKSHSLVLGGCEVIEANNNDANSMNHISGGDFVDVSLMQNWNSSTNFSY